MNLLGNKMEYGHNFSKITLAAAELLVKREYSCYLVIKTKHTNHYIERVTYTDRGKFKWIAETEINAPLNEKNAEWQRSFIDRQDLFPRLYFVISSLVVEMSAWLDARQLEITSAELVKI